jgi:hypothetical protein
MPILCILLVGLKLAYNIDSPHNFFACFAREIVREFHHYELATLDMTSIVLNRQ